MTTNALGRPGSGLATLRTMNDSHCPEILDTSSFVLFTTAEMRDDFPRVPTKIGNLCTPRIVDRVRTMVEAVAFAVFAVTPVTMPMSFAKSVAARCTPGHSSAERITVAAAPPDTTVKLLGEDLN